ncbi:MAG: MBL fold metallo-hydrolase [Nocardioides sp.]|uniref:MBL fold metallo-hydrolase n=1 Tax=Nocardioides sp. TaxID=35761 RepID=UPI0039E6B6C3
MSRRTAAGQLVRGQADAPPLAVAGRPRRVVPMVLGYEPIPEAISLEGGSGFRYLLEPVTAAAIVFDEGWILVDGGFAPALRALTRGGGPFEYENYLPIVPTVDPLREQIAVAGLALDGLAALLLTHAHFDHTGGARLLERHQPLLLQRREWEYVLGVEDERAAFVFADDLVRPGLGIVLLDGDAVVAPGLRVIDTAGHTPGHQSIVVELAEGTIVLAGDAADLRTNIDRRVATGATAGEDGPSAARRAIALLADLDERPGTTVWPAHDPDWSPWRAAVDAQPVDRPGR